MPKGPGGRPKKPTALRILHGDEERHINRKEPKPEPIAPPMPAGMRAEAKREWARVAPELERIGLLTKIDGASLAIYCEAWATFVAARNDLKKRGHLVAGTHPGSLVQNPSWVTLKGAADIVKRFASEFGLTPSARASLEMPGEGGQDLDGILEANEALDSEH